MTTRTQNYRMDSTTESINCAWKNEVLKLEQDNPVTVGEEELLSIIHIKRFYERWRADSAFREQLSVDPYKAVVRHGLKVDPEEVRQMWDKEFAEKISEEVPVSPSWAAWEHYWELAEKFRLQKRKSIAASSSNLQFKAWRERQIARAESQLMKLVNERIGNYPICFELNKGCSVGCPFCAVSAPRLSDIFTYNKENAQLWREVLELMKEIIGPAAGAGFCFWATDPLDNPDYEKFCSDFHEVLGAFPPTTTAQSMKDPERTRSLLQLSREKGCLSNRFSILSLKMFNQVHAEFSAEELAFVGLTLRNKEADPIIANAGRAREQNIRKGEKDSELFDQGTIACVTGFLLNMVDRSVKLISPCHADERWPLGYIIYDEGNFSDVNNLKILLERMIADNMPLTVRPNDLMSFRRDLKYESLTDGFKLSNKFKTFKFHNDPYLRELGDVIRSGNKTAEEIALLLEIYSVPRAHTFHTFNSLLERGVLDDEPKPKAAELRVQD